MMKILSVAVPSYNSEKYLDKCVESLLKSGEGIEILIVNDGSRDRTKEIADTYAKKYPDRIKAIHQANAGHGGAVNAGIEHASGKYFKVVDSDDWVNPVALKKVVAKLKEFVESETKVDMFIANFMYDKVGAEKKKIMEYTKVIPKDKVITWSEVGRFHTGKYILMHSVIYSLQVLKDCGLSLPKHTFYVDNLFVYEPLPYVETMYYMDECVYHYFIGRDEQSVNEDVMIRRIDQQLLVNRLMMENTNLKKVTNRKKRRYMLQYLIIITSVSSILLIKSGTEENMEKKKILWKSIREFDFGVYLKMRTCLLGNLLHLPGNTGRKVTLFVYKQAQERVGFN